MHLVLGGYVGTSRLHTLLLGRIVSRQLLPDVLSVDVVELLRRNNLVLAHLVDCVHNGAPQPGGRPLGNILHLLDVRVGVRHLNCVRIAVIILHTTVHSFFHSFTASSVKVRLDALHFILLEDGDLFLLD